MVDYLELGPVQGIENTNVSKSALLSKCVGNLLRGGGWICVIHYRSVLKGIYAYTGRCEGVVSSLLKKVRNSFKGEGVQEFLTFRKEGKCSQRKQVQSHRKVTQQDRFEEIEVIPSVFGVEAVRGLVISDTGEVGKSHVDHRGLHLLGLDAIMDEDACREFKVAVFGLVQSFGGNVV